MAELPLAIWTYLNKLVLYHRDPAYLLVDRQGRLMAWGGQTAKYGISDLSQGGQVGELVLFLEGLFPLKKERLILPCVQTGSGRPAELHLFSTAENDCVLLLDATSQERQQQLIQQKGNELSLSYQRLLKEIQKKEILLHCIVHDLAGPLMGIKGGFEMLAREQLPEQARQFLEIGLRQATRQERLIREILQAFSAEIESVKGFKVDSDKAPDALLAIKEVADALSPAFAFNQVKLRLAPNIDISRDWKVVGEKSRLERVISNLVENALHQSKPNSTVTIGCHDAGDRVLMTVDDKGPGIPPEIAPTIFQKFTQGKTGRGKIGLGLYFCRITVEHWGGEIGHTPRKQGGTRFWFRLPRPQGQEEKME